ncbi:MAG: dTMP kinase [Pseudomonadota bacterium]
MDKRGRFITIEGSEGVGKSTQIEAVCAYLRSCGVDLVVTREPGGTAISEAIRELLLDPDKASMHPDTELLLMFAARAEHLRQTIEPALVAGRWVFCDRFTDATYAYQGGGRELDATRIAVLEQWVHPHTQPDLTVLLDIPVAIGLERARARGPADRFERETDPFFERVRATYLARAEAHARFAVIDAGATISEVTHQIRATLHARFPELGQPDD